MEDVACGRCGMPGFREGTQLPFGWEAYRAGDYRGVVWCGGCVDQLLGDVLNRLGNAPAAWWDDDGAGSPDA